MPVTVLRVQSRFAFPPAATRSTPSRAVGATRTRGSGRPCTPAACGSAACKAARRKAARPICVCAKSTPAGALPSMCLPCGNWSIEVTAQPNTAGLDVYPFAVVNLGLADDDLRLELSPGETIECPEVLVQSLPGGEPSAAAPRLHQWLREASYSPHSGPRCRWCTTPGSISSRCWKRRGCGGSCKPPKTWAARCLSSTRAGTVRRRAVGGSRRATGERESRPRFAARWPISPTEVRAAGLGFGLWMEPERFGPDVPIRREHPEWFHPGQPPFARIDLENPAAYAYLRDEISRLVETYRLAWMKVDFNFELGLDARAVNCRATIAHGIGCWTRYARSTRRRFLKGVPAARCGWNWLV